MPHSTQKATAPWRSSGARPAAKVGDGGNVQRAASSAGVIDMAVRGLEGIDETVQQTYIWIDEVADRFHGSRHQGLQIIRAFLHLLRDHLSVDESAQLAAQLPMLLRGAYYEGWDPTHDRRHERSREAFIDAFVTASGVRQADAPDAIAAAGGVLRRHISQGELDDVFQALPISVRPLLG